MFDNAATQTEKTQIIMNAFEKQGGRWIMNYDKPFFKDQRDK